MQCLRNMNSTRTRQHYESNKTAGSKRREKQMVMTRQAPSVESQ